MPIYAFACDACGHHFDRLQKLSDADPAECPACAAQGAVRRKLTAPQFRLSGGGWYETDFKKDGDSKRNLAGEGGEGAKPASSSSDPKPEAKPEAKPEPAPLVTDARPFKPAADSKPAAAAKPAVSAD